MLNSTLSELSLKIISGLTPLRSKSSYWNDGSVPWLKTEQLGEKYVYETNECISQKALESTSIKLVPENALSIAMYGEGKTRGNVSIIKVPMTTNQACCNVILDSKKADHEYIYYYLKTQYNELRNLSSGVRKNLNSNDIKGFSIRHPERVEVQRELVAALIAIDKKIELNSRINAELEAMAKTLYDYWFVQFDFPDANGKPYKTSGGKMVYNETLKREIPEGWGVSNISSIIDVKDGTHASPKPVEQGFPLITSKNLKKSGLDFDNANLISESDYISVNMRSQVDTGDILFSMIGNIGTIYKVDEQEINFAIKNVALYKTCAVPELQNYIYMYLNSWDMLRYMGNVTSGSIQKFIGLGALRDMPIFLNEEIVALFENKTKSIFSQMTTLKFQNQELVSLRDWLLPMLMNGQVTVK